MARGARRAWKGEGWGVDIEGVGADQPGRREYEHKEGGRQLKKAGEKRKNVSSNENDERGRQRKRRNNFIILFSVIPS